MTDSLLIAGLVFLYLPIAALVITGFNDSRLTTVWTGVSLRWYRVLAGDRTLIDAALLSLRIAAASATVATLLGTAAGYSLARHGRFAGRRLFAFLLAAPLVLPDALVGLSLLLLFVALEAAFGWPAGRGALTVTLAHATLGLASVAVVVQARLEDVGTALEQAAADLGAAPPVVFWLITLPLLAPAIAAGWLLAFTLSLDDVVVASFTTGPGASTLPIVVLSSLRLGATPELDALATVLLAAVALLLLPTWFVLRRRAVVRGIARE